MNYKKELKQYKLLALARKLIVSPEAWTKGVYARDLEGNKCGTWRKESCKFCAIGAIRAAHGLLGYKTGDPASWRSAREVLKCVNGEQKWRCLEHWNDHPETKHAEVISAFDAAIDVKSAKIEASQ